MHSSALSMPPTGVIRREKSNRSRLPRSKSQPASEHTPSFISSTNPRMKNVFVDLLHLSIHPSYLSPNSHQRTKLGSSLAFHSNNDRLSRLRLHQGSSLTYPSSSMEIRRVPPTILTKKFRRAGKLILFAIYWCNFARNKTLLRSANFQSYLQTSRPTEKYMFDKSHFKIQSIEILPEVQAFFKQPPGARDLSKADQIRKCLTDIKPFTRLPRHLQDRLLQQAWYACYPEGRTIVRQHERASCFYIILSGSAIPTCKRATDGSLETLDVLKRGSTFGEKGLMADLTQNFTVTSKSPLELLVLWKDDFKSIFMTSDRHCSKDDLRFLKNNVPFLHGFPIDRLNESSDAIQHCSFRQSEVIARDSRRMKHIFIVRKGSLALWKRLDPQNPPAPNSAKSQFLSTSREITTEGEDEATGDDHTIFSEVQLSSGTEKSIFHLSKLEADARLTRLRRSNVDDQRISSATSVSSRSIQTEDKSFPGLLDKRDRLQTIDYDSLTVNLNKKKHPPAGQSSTHGTSLTHSKSRLIYPDKMVYIHVKTLNEGQHFGITDMIFPNQPVLTLISNGCECILLHKASFIEIASDQYKQNLRRTEIPFPSDLSFYKNYNSNEVWKRLSQKIYLDAYQRVKPEKYQSQRRSASRHKHESQHFQQSILMGPL